ncbi:MAG: flavin-dependent oxidoreductase [Pikeienuella sp.]
MTVLIAGGGIAGLSLGLTCAEIGVPFYIFEAARTFRPLGVGINLQPNAVRELFDLGLESTLRNIGVETQEYGFYTKSGLEIWNEPRGLGAGYAWPQFSVHRGELQMALYEALEARAPGCVKSGCRAVGFENHSDGASLFLQNADGQTQTASGSVVIAADGIHSALRAQMNPDEGAPIWNGTVLWRATTRAKPFRTGASMALIGHGTQRVVSYPISKPDGDGLSLMNWIAELTFDPSQGWGDSDWNRPVDPEKFMPEFTNWSYDWLDFHSMVANATEVLEYPMVDRDPLEQWTHGAVTLIGDAAHATYPVGSNGASQAIVDARKLGASFLTHGLNQNALLAYEAELRPQTTGLVLANRGGNGPDAVLQQVEDLCGGDFENIEDVIPRADLAAHAAKYKKIAGFSIDELNAQPKTIPAGARMAQSS